MLGKGKKDVHRVDEWGDRKFVFCQYLVFMFSELDHHSCLKLGRGTLDLNTSYWVCSPQGDLQEVKWVQIWNLSRLKVWAVMVYLYFVVTQISSEYYHLNNSCENTDTSQSEWTRSYHFFPVKYCGLKYNVHSIQVMFFTCTLNTCYNHSPKKSNPKS